MLPHPDRAVAASSSRRGRSPLAHPDRAPRYTGRAVEQAAAEFGLASPRSVGAATASVVVMVDDVDAHHGHAAARGAEVVYEPVDQPYGYREYSARDLEGGLWSFMKELS